MSVVDTVVEVGKWLGRLVALLPAIERFWSAVERADDANADLTGEQIAAALELVRSIKRQQAKEELEG